MSRRSLAVTQLDILAGDAHAVDGWAYTVVSQVRMSGVPGVEAVRDATVKTIARHDVFSWRLHLDAQGVIMAHADPAALPAVTVSDLSAMTPSQAEAVIHDLAATQRRRRIALFRPGEVYLRLSFHRMPLRPGNTDTDVVVTLMTHHILIDERTVELLWAEVAARVAGRDFPIERDQRYARWAADTVSERARQRSHAAADSLLAATERTSLARLDERATPSPSSGLRDVVVPGDLCVAANRSAAALAVPASDVWCTAMAQALLLRTGGSAVALHVPLSRRTVDDLDVVGCFISGLPLIAGHRHMFGPHGVVRWRQAVQIASRFADADLGTVIAGIGHPPQISVAVDSLSRSIHSLGQVRWTILPPPPTTAKHAVSVYLAPGRAGNPGSCRIVWRSNVMADDDAQVLAGDFLSQLSSLTAA